MGSLRCKVGLTLIAAVNGGLPDGIALNPMEEWGEDPVIAETARTGLLYTEALSDPVEGGEL